MYGDDRAPDDPGVVVIKRYPNRRLYDTRASRYVALEEVAAVVRDGATVQVVDSRTGADVTRAVLVQAVLLGAEDGGAGLFSAALLHGMLRAARALREPAAAPLMAWVLATITAAWGGGPARARALPWVRPARSREKSEGVVASESEGAEAGDDRGLRALERRVEALEAAVRRLAEPPAPRDER